MWLVSALEKFRGGLLHLISYYTVIQHLRICSRRKTCGLSGDRELYLWWLHSHIQTPIWCYSHQVMSKTVWKKHCSLSWHQILFLLFRTKQMSCLADWAVSHVSMRYGEIMMIPAFCLPFISPWFHIEKLQAKALWQLLHPNSTQHYSYISSSIYRFCSLPFSPKPVNCCDSFSFSFFFHPIFLSFRGAGGGRSVIFLKKTIFSQSCSELFLINMYLISSGECMTKCKGKDNTVVWSMRHFTCKGKL